MIGHNNIWVQSDVCGGEDDNSGWFHKDCVEMKGVDFTNERYECPVCKGEVQNVADIAQQQESIVTRHKEMLIDLQ